MSQVTPEAYRARENARQFMLESLTDKATYLPLPGLYVAVLAACGVTGWPIHYKPDVTCWDLDYFIRNPAPQYLWAVNECGSHMIGVPGKPQTKRMQQTIRNSFDGARFFIIRDDGTYSEVSSTSEEEQP